MGLSEGTVFILYNPGVDSAKDRIRQIVQKNRNAKTGRVKMKTTGVLLVFLILSAGVFWNTAFSQSAGATGSIKGKVSDAGTKAPLIGANISIMNTMMGAATDLQGNFIIPNVPVGSYSLKFSYVGYETLVKTDVIVKARRATFVNAELRMTTMEADSITVFAGYFSKTDEQPVSAINFSNEEIRRAPGSAGDVSRILMSLPSIAKVNDQTNNLIVRGGSPVENGFFIDNIEIPNINHFPTQGSSGGPIGLVNVDFIQDVSFSAGGFPARFGDRLSSIMEITFREGNRSEFDGQLDLNFAGFGVVAEGPLFDNKSSWLFSARRSYLDLLVKVLNTGTTVAPRFGDYQGKFVYDINPNHKVMIVGVWGDDHNNPDRETAIENDMLVYGNQDIYERTTGVNWRALWGKSGYSNTSLAYTSSGFKENFKETATGNPVVNNRSLEQVFKFRNVNHFRLNNRNSLEFGAEAKHLMSNFNIFYAEYTDALGKPVSAFLNKNKITADKIGVFASYIAKPFPRFSATLGIRADYFSYNKSRQISPRFTFSYRLTDRTSLNGSTGLFYQNLPLLLLSQNKAHKRLKTPSAKHYILGIDHLLTPDTKLTLEIYQKNYDHFPLDPSQPALFLLDELYYRYGFFFNHERLVDRGKACSGGAEVTLQKKLAQNFYGLVSASYFRTRYRGLNGAWRDRVFDNRALFSIEGGYKPNKKWEFSLRWIYAGGAPYTPLDIEASKAQHRAVLNENKINKARYPDYHSLNVRFDRRFHWGGSNLIFYLSVWNAYNHKNVATYFWNDKKQKQDQIYQWLLLPIFGLEYEL